MVNYIYRHPKEQAEEVHKVVRLLEERVLELEKDLKNPKNIGIKKLMQDNYALNKNLLKTQTALYKSLIGG